MSEPNADAEYAAEVSTMCKAIPGFKGADASTLQLAEHIVHRLHEAGYHVAQKSRKTADLIRRLEQAAVVNAPFPARIYPSTMREIIAALNEADDPRTQIDSSGKREES